MKKLLLIITSIVLVFTVLFIAWVNCQPTKISYFVGCVESTINTENLPEVIGVNDYVFVGRVDEIYDYNHDRFFHKFPEIIDYYSGPFTECKVTVIESIKGNIPKDSQVSYYKVGGVNWFRTSIYLPVEEGKTDYYPEVGKYYIFRGSAHPDGTITGGGTYSTDLLEDGFNDTNYQESAIYKEWVTAYENQVTENAISPHYLCSADMDYGDGTYNAEIYEEYNEQKEAKGSSIDEKYYKAVKDGNPKIK